MTDRPAIETWPDAATIAAYMRGTSPDEHPSPNPHCAWVEGYLTPSECAALVEAAPTRLDPDRRCGARAGEPGNHPVVGEVVRLIAAINDQWWGLDIDRVLAPVLEYRRGDSYDWHVDTAPGRACRKLSCSALLTDGYRGGDFELDGGQGETWVAPRTLGTVIVFPAWSYHRVTRIISGVRKALIVQTIGPRLR